MNKVLLAVLSLLCLITAGDRLLGATVPAPPDFAALNDISTSLAAKKWQEYQATHYPDDTRLKGVVIQGVQRADELLGGEKVQIGYEELDHATPDNPVYLVSMICQASWQKRSTQNVLVLQWRGGRYHALLSFVGGCNWRGVESAIVDLGSKTQRYGLLVSDEGSGNQSSQTRTHIFLYDPARDAIAEVFNELTTYMPGREGMIYEGAVSFRASDRPLADILVRADVSRCPSGRQVRTTESVFKWNGQRYDGRLDVPAEAFE